LKYPAELHVDNSTEFKADVLKLMKKKERFNKTLAERLYKPQDTKDSKIWVKYLYRIVKNLNNEKTQMLGMTPVKAVKLDNVELKVKPYPKERAAPEDRYLYQPI